MRRKRIALVLAAACLAAGCGGDDDDGGGDKNGGGETSAAGDEADVRQALTDYADAVADNDPAAACELMTTKAQEEAKDEVPGSSDCEGAHKTVLAALGSGRDGLAKQLAGVDFDVKIDGETAELTSARNRGDPLKMKREDGDWKLDQNTLTFNPTG